MLRISLVFLVGLCSVRSLQAAPWADGLFEELSKDFGSVPRGPALVHPFRLVNKTKTPIHIADVRVSCGCVTASVYKDTLQPGEETSVLAHMDTTRFSGVKTVTIYVHLDRPSWEEVRLWVQANSRDDVTVAPATLAFGQTKRAGSPSRKATVTFLGHSVEQILSIKSDSNYVLTSLRPVQTSPPDISYELTATLRDDAPVGKWYTDIWLQTTNAAMPQVRVPLTVEIESNLSISPATVVLGQVKVGGETQRKVIVRGVKPFRITDVRGTDDFLQVKDSTQEPRTVHVLTVKLKGTRAGDLARTLQVITDMQEEGEIQFHARADIVP